MIFHKWYAAAAALALFNAGAACGSPARPAPQRRIAIASQTDTEQTGAGPERVLVQNPAPLGGVLVAGTPLDARNATVAVKWVGKPSLIRLVRKPDDHRPSSDQLSVQTGTDIPFGNSIVQVITPRTVAARRDIALEQIAPYPPQAADNVDAPTQLATGQDIEILIERADECVLRIHERLWTATCPTLDDFTAIGWEGELTPLKHIWWIQPMLDELGTTGGWMQVDGAQAVGFTR